MIQEHGVHPDPLKSKKEHLNYFLFYYQQGGGDRGGGGYLGVLSRTLRGGVYKYYKGESYLKYIK